MDEQERASGPVFNSEKPPEAAGSLKKKRGFWFVVGAFLALFLLVAGMAAWQIFDNWRGQKGVELLYERLKAAQEELYQRQLADTYGGKTPQETLQMYIEAVEAGDYDLASKYFVIEKQKNELISLKSSSQQNLLELLSLLKQAKEISKEEDFWIEYKSFVNTFDRKDMTFEEYVKLFELEKRYAERRNATMTTKVNSYNFQINFVLYPNGVWKIEEI